MRENDWRYILHEVEADDRVVLNGEQRAVEYAVTDHDHLRREVGLYGNTVLLCDPNDVSCYVPETPPDPEGFKRKKIRNLSIAKRQS